VNQETHSTRSGQARHCQNCKAEFVIEPEDFVFYDKIKVPPPTWCPECRLIRRLVFRNERNLYRVKDAASGQEIFSGIPPDSGLKVYEHDYWWSDKWDPMPYGRDYDFSRPFFEQFLELMYSVPWPARNVLNLVNSDYAEHVGNLRNCYLCFNLGDSEDSAYLIDTYWTKNSFDITTAEHSELCYDSIEIDKSYKTFFSLYCDETRDVWFSRDLTGCSDCFGCVNLRNKQYHIFNRPYSKEAYFEELQKMNLNSYSGLDIARRRAYEFWRAYPRKFYHGVQNVNVSGDCLHNCKNVLSSYNVEDGENLKFCMEASLGVKDSYDYTNWGDNVELMYETFGCGLGCKNVKFSLDCWSAVSDIEYSVRSASSSNLFGCVGLKKKSYCIFNKQYTPEEYAVLREKIIRHMAEMPYADAEGRTYRYGEFFPPGFSPFSYQETVANDFFPLSKEEAAAKGYTWRDSEIKEFQMTMKASAIPDAIGDTPDSIIQEIIECSSCGRAYRIIASELQFLRAQGISVPRECVSCRHKARFSMRNLPRYYSRKCMCAGESSENAVYRNQVSHSHGIDHCENEFITSFAPENPSIVYCESCYNSEVV